jgi:hypothetical protein
MLRPNLVLLWGQRARGPGSPSTRLIALRSAGFNNVDLASAEKPAEIEALVGQVRNAEEGFGPAAFEKGALGGASLFERGRQKALGGFVSLADEVFVGETGRLASPHITLLDFSREALLLCPNHRSLGGHTVTCD